VHFKIFKFGGSQPEQRKIRSTFKEKSLALLSSQETRKRRYKTAPVVVQDTSFITEERLTMTSPSRPRIPTRTREKIKDCVLTSKVTIVVGPTGKFSTVVRAAGATQELYAFSQDSNRPYCTYAIQEVEKALKYQPHCWKISAAPSCAPSHVDWQ
jgi:hypothetical protein